MITRNHTDDVAYFIAFCVEIYKNAHSVAGTEVSEIFARHNIMEYLEENYEILHTQSPDWILSEIDEIINDNPQ